MSGLRKRLRDLNIGKDWTLLLDRDGVINRRIEGDYVRSWEQFEFLPKVIEALKVLRSVFGRIIVVTNQRGIGRGLMTEEDLQRIHESMCKVLNSNGVYVDAIYYCPHDYEKEECNCRKPKTGLALKAKEDFPEIDFRKSVIVGDSVSDMEFGAKLGMVKVFMGENSENCEMADFAFGDLWSFAESLIQPNSV